MKRKKSKPAWRQRLEYLLYRAVARRAGRATPEGVSRWGSRIGNLASRLVRGRDRLAMRNLRFVFPEKSEEERRRILDDCWRHFGRETMGYLRLQNLPQEEALRRVTIVNRELVDEARALDRGLVVISAHYGSWEVAALVMMSLADNVRTVARKLDNPYLERDVTASRARMGAQFIDKRQAARALVKGLAEKAVLVLLPDQAVSPQKGMLLPFMGRPAWTTPAPARLAAGAVAPIVFAFCIPDGSGYRLEFEELIRVDLLDPEKRDPAVLTQRINDVISRRIVARPELWLWMHDRWKGTGESEVTNG